MVGGAAREPQLLAATAACVEPDGINTLGIELPVEELSLVASLSHPDWLTVALNAVRAGAGQRCDPGTIARWFDDDPDEGDLSEEDLEFLTAAFTINAPIWQAAGVTDNEHRFTELGVWLLPRALAREWGDDLAPFSQADLDEIAAELNDRPRQTLGWRSPSQALDAALR